MRYNRSKLAENGSSLKNFFPQDKNGGGFMASEKELFVTKQYVPTGEPISQNDHTLIYKVKCLAEPGHPDGILKIYRKQNIQKLYSQLKILDYSEWPHIYSVKYFDDSTLVVEEFLKGSTLAELLERNKIRGTTFSEEDAYHIMEQVCRYIEELMGLQPQIIHHNLKPSNIFVTSTGRVKFLDFVPDYKKKRTSLGGILNILGSIFHEMLTGKKPEKQKCTCGKRYESVIRKCLEKNPEKQYQNMKEVESDLEYARNQVIEEEERESIGMPYTLTLPFQGIILSFEWILLVFFHETDNLPSCILFALIFFIHLGCFAVRRHSYIRKKGVSIGAARTLLPFLALGAVFVCLYFAVAFLIVPTMA